MSPRIENAIHLPSGLQTGSAGPGRDLREQMPLDAIGEAEAIRTGGDDRGGDGGSEHRSADAATQARTHRAVIWRMTGL
jgi:hypothetical protein